MTIYIIDIGFSLGSLKSVFKKLNKKVKIIDNPENLEKTNIKNNSARYGFISKFYEQFNKIWI